MPLVKMPPEGFPECRRCEYAASCGALKNKGGYCVAFRTFARKASSTAPEVGPSRFVPEEYRNEA
jgi:hypothetical protein